MSDQINQTAQIVGFANAANRSIKVEDTSFAYRELGPRGATVFRVKVNFLSMVYYL